MAETPKRKNISQTPYELIETNKVPFIACLVVFLLLMGYFLYKAQTKHKPVMTDNRPAPQVDIGQKESGQRWFEDEKYGDSNYSMKKIVVNTTPQTPQEIEKQVMTNQEIDYKQEEINDDYSAKLEIEKLEKKQEVEAKKLEYAAATSPMNVDVPPAPGTKPNAAINIPALPSALTENSALTQVTKGIKLPGAAQQAAPDLNNQDEKLDFLKDKGNDEGDYLKYNLEKPKSKYEIQAGTYIPSILIGGINSDVPGPVTAQVSQNVYDSVTGNDILIPQGSRLIGTYDSKISYGQNRAIVVWNRVIFPGGKSIDLGSMQGLDISGFAGLHDRVNNHYLRIYGNALLLGFMGAGYDLLNNQQSNNNNGQFNAQQAVAANVGQKMSDVASQTLQKNMDVQPTITIPNGYRFNVIVLKDMLLEKIDDVEGSLSYTS